MLSLISKLFTLLAATLCISICCFSQKNSGRFPEVGKQIMDFSLKNVRNYEKPCAAKIDFAGKFLILDFWNKYCTSCINSFPKTNQLQELFADKLKIVLVGWQDSEKEIEPLYEKLRNRLGINLTTAFDSSVYKKLVPGKAAPHLIWIDDKGVVKAVTLTSALNAHNIEAFINGRNFPFNDQSHLASLRKIAYNNDKPFLLFGNGGRDDDFSFRSVLSTWKFEMPTSPFRPLRYIKNLLQGRMNLAQLYMYANLGQHYFTPFDSIYNKVLPRPILEVADSTPFTYNYETGSGVYLYSLSVPESKARSQFILHCLRKDLEKYFGYEAKLENRVVECLKLIVSDSARAKIVTKGGESRYLNDSHTFLKVTNYNWQTVFQGIFTKFLDNAVPPIIDATGIGGNVDFEFHPILDNFESLKTELKSLGFDIIKGDIEMKVLVIRDSMYSANVTR